MNPNTKEPTEPVPTIMVVDDSQANLKLLGSLFRERGYQVRPFSQGKLALLGASKQKPDLILLDINMPEMDGFEVCRQLKADPELSAIPVIFLSTLTDASDKVRAFQCGAVDYVTKQPFHFEEIQARVDAHLKIRSLQRELERKNRQLQENFDQLAKVEALRDNLIHMIVHDMRSPLTVLVMAMRMFKEDQPPGDQSKCEYLDMGLRSATSLVEMVNQMLDISRLESGKMPLSRSDCDLVAVCRAALGSVAPLIAERRTEIQGEERLLVSMDEALVLRVLANLLGNAVKFTQPTGSIRIELLRDGQAVRVSVVDDGIGIPASYLQSIFDKFSQVESEKRKYGTGLGLTFCKLAVEAHGGTIGVESVEKQGSRFWFTLPLNQQGS